MILNRRTFLKVGSALTGGLLLTKYEEPIERVIIPAHGRAYIEDRDSYYFVRVPDGQVLRNERFDKPVFMVLEGPYSLAEQIEVAGFLNLSHSKGRLQDCFFDGSGVMTVKPRRGLVTIDGDSALTITGCHFIGGPSTESCIYCEASSGLHANALSFIGRTT